MQNREHVRDPGLAALTHILGLFTGFIDPLIVCLLRPQEDFVKDQARESLNFQITVVIASIISGILVIILVGALLLLIVGLGDLILSIVGAVRASEGLYYRYPFCIRILQPPQRPFN